MKRIYTIILAAVICLTGCSTYKYSSRSVAVENRNIVATPTVVDVNVDYSTRITETSHKCKTQSEAVQEAKYKAITGHNIDILVDMICKIEKKGGKYIATVTGFAGHYENSRTLYEDIRQMSDLKMEDVEKYLILHNPEAIKYVNQKGETVNIYHTENQ